MVLRNSGETVPATPTQLNETLDLPKPTIHRLCARLEDAGFFQRSLDGKGLTVGPRLRAIAQNSLFSGEQSILIRSVLERVSKTVGETANITVPDCNHMRYLDRVETQWPLRLQLPVGSQVPLHCTASGKLYLSSLSPGTQASLLKSLNLEKLTPTTITDAAALQVAVSEIAERGFSTDDEEFIEGMVAVAVPVRNAKSHLVATLAIHAPVIRMSLAEAIAWVPELQRAADELLDGSLASEGVVPR